MPGQQRPLSGVARSSLAWTLTRLHGGGLRHRFSGTCRAGIVLDSPFAAGVADRSDGLFFADRTGDGRDLRRRSQPVRLLGLSARRFGADLPFRSWGGACECQLGRSSAADFNHAGLCRGDDLELPVDFTAFPGRTRSLRGRIVPTVATLLIGGLTFLAIRGGVTVATANVSKVYFSSNMFLNHAATNPVFRFSLRSGTMRTMPRLIRSSKRSGGRLFSKSCGATVPGPMPVRPDCCAATGRTSY